MNRDKSVEAEASLADPRVLVGSGSGFDLIPFRNGIFFQDPPPISNPIKTINQINHKYVNSLPLIFLFLGPKKALKFYDFRR